MSTVLRSSELDRLYQTVADVLGVTPDAISAESSPASVPHWDSLNHLNLVMAIEQEFQVSLTPEDALEMRSVARIQDILERETPPPPQEGITFENFQPSRLPDLKKFVAHCYHKDYVLGANKPYLDWQYGPRDANSRWTLRLALVGGQIAGCLGYIPVQLDIGGQTVSAAWLANWMVDPRCRELGLGPTLARQVSDQFDVSLAVGANTQARKILTRLGWTDLGCLRRYVCILDLEQTARLTESGTLNWPAKTSRNSSNRPAGVKIALVDRLDARATDLWHETLGRDYSSAGTRRDERYLRWRYTNHPQLRYRIFEARVSDKLIGFAVYRIEQARDISVRAGRLVELVAERGADGWLLDAVLDNARESHVAAVDFFCGSDQFSETLGQRGFLSDEHPETASVPLLYQPIDRKKTGITFLADLRNVPHSARIANWYVTKADGDQDRPN